MSLYSDYYFNSAQAVVEIDCIEIQHFRFNPTVFRLTRNAQLHELSTFDDEGNAKRGVIVMHEGAVGPFEYEYVPMKIERIGVGTDMEQALRVTFGDVGEILPAQLELVDTFNANTAKPIVRYRAYRSDDLSAPLTTVPSVHEMKRVTFNRQGCAFEAIAPYLNVARTGQLYTIQDYPTMKAFFRNR